MVQVLNPIEINTIKDILNKGLNKAAVSFSYFVNEKIKMSEPVFKLESIQQCLKINYKQQVRYVLKTKIYGEVKGVSYLIFSESDAERLFQFAIPEAVSLGREEYEKISLALLLELDNIVSASVVSQFDEILDCKIYGGVPSFENIDNNNIDQDFSEGNFADAYILNVEFSFLSNNEDFSPDFFWILSPEFIEKVKQLSKLSESN